MDPEDDGQQEEILPEEPGVVQADQQCSVIGPFSARVRGIDAEGMVFDSDTILNSLSGRGCSMQLLRRVMPGSKVFAVIYLALTRSAKKSGPRVAIRGVVRRVVPSSTGHYEVEVNFTRHRFL